MSKLFKLTFLTYQLIFFLLGFLVSPQILKPVLAYTTIDPRITITHTPDPVYADSGTVAFKIEATGGVPLPLGNYTYTITIPDKPDKNECGSSRTFRNDDPNVIVVTAVLQKNDFCKNIFGSRTFDLIYGLARGGSSIVNGYNFDVQQAGGGAAPRVEALNQHLGISETPEVIIHNVKSGTTYSFWWDGAGGFPLPFGSIATQYTATADGDSGKIAINKIGVDFNREETKTLCMAIGNHLFVYPGIPCEGQYKTTFNFLLIPPPSSTAPSNCSASPPSPTEIQSVSVKARNLPKNENFRADLIIKDTTINLLQTQNSGASGIVSLPLAAFLTKGSYSTKVYNAKTNDLVCEANFEISPTGPPTGKTSKIQTLSIIPCGDSADPGIATAIGCIHTSPASLAKDFVKFFVTISGGLAFLMMLLGAFQMLTSAGNPETLSAGKDRLQSAIIGLLFIIFAVLLLKIIGVDILGIPGFKM